MLFLSSLVTWVVVVLWLCHFCVVFLVIHRLYYAVHAFAVKRLEDQGIKCVLTLNGRKPAWAVRFVCHPCYLHLSRSLASC